MRRGVYSEKEMGSKEEKLSSEEQEEVCHKEFTDLFEKSLAKELWDLTEDSPVVEEKPSCAYCGLIQDKDNEIFYVEINWGHFVPCCMGHYNQTTAGFNFDGMKKGQPFTVRCVTCETDSGVSIVRCEDRHHGYELKCRDCSQKTSQRLNTECYTCGSPRGLCFKKVNLSCFVLRCHRCKYIEQCFDWSGVLKRIAKNKEQEEKKREKKKEKTKPEVKRKLPNMFSALSIE
jgi:hypothetical protein